MDSRPWEKFEATKYLALMQEHPNDIIGKWFRVWCTLANSKTRWVKTGTIETWGRIIGEDIRTTKRFINYASMNISNIEITTAIGKEGAIITITEVYYKMIDKSLRVRGRNAAKYKKSDITSNREELKNKVINEYHFNRRKQLPTFNKEFNKIMAETNRPYNTNEQKIDAENAKCEEIITYIKWLSTTPEWKGEGTFILGIGNMIKDRPWEYKYRPDTDTKKNNKDKIIEDIEKYKG
jgi:hypothetical protein